jgi:phytoene desaturase
MTQYSGIINTRMGKKIVIIGAGVGGLATACILGQAGYDVTIYEKNSQAGGHAGTFSAQGFTFDTGPSWYLMPDIFEHFFELLGEDVNKLLKLKRLDPSYRVFFKDKLFGAIDIVGDVERDGNTLEALEPGSRNKLRNYLKKSSYQYNLALDQFLYKNYDSAADFLTPSVLAQGLRMNVFSNMQKYVSKHFSSTEVQKILQYPLVFLGANPNNAPALYSMMSHIDFNQGVFYPEDGIYRLTKTLVKLAEARGATIVLNAPIDRITVKNRQATGVVLEDGTKVTADIVISNADIAHTEQRLLSAEYRSYSNRYFSKRTLAPSALVMYLGVNKQYPNLRHHNLIFSKDWDANFKAIFGTKKWPHDPSFYVCNPSKTDKTVAPKNHENLFVLVPLPASTDYTDQDLQKYADWILNTMEKVLHLDGLTNEIVYKKILGAKDFEQTYNSYHGTALGFAHTLKQTAAFRPSNRSKKVKNLYYVGAGTSPGIGLPMCLISAQLVYKRLTGNKTSQTLKTI